MKNIKIHDTNKLIHKTKADSQTENEFTVAGRGRGDGKKGPLGSLGWTCTHMGLGSPTV